MSTTRLCDTCGRSEVQDWLTVKFKRERWDFCSPACFHAAGEMLSAILPAPWVALP